MKGNRKIIYFTFILLFLPSVIFAQIFKCTKNGKVVYQSDPCKKIESKEKTTHRSGFQFDGWKAGMKLSEMIQIARQKQLPISPGNFTLNFLS
ncbi:MAG: DUF4124 domain-containing protein [Candidatus Electrothrix sp. AR4]|nr:DUF4124 domain-containing protein [Candidatus Electrothrix sp. AR4]